ncbi:GNAT family N-acetyltransferase [Micromonospora sp. CA-246542]|uniref:GNAT family N-acetyltransferase n=1 Tax=Micromonospora sp. CA-246542 TaxID=3239959 RepID=UPI003D8CAD31
MATTSIYDLQPQLAANRRYWTGWDGSEPDTDLPIYRTGLPQGLLNGVLRVRNRPLDDAVEEAMGQLAGSRWSWWVGADSDVGTAEGLFALGATQSSDMPVMAIDVTKVATYDTPRNLRIRPVTSKKEMQEYVRAYAGPLGFPDGPLDARVDRELDFTYPDVVRLAAVIDGKTVGTCTLSLGTGVGALYSTTTDADYRRRGIATALILESLRIVRESGRRIVTLQASSDGEPVYRRIGFETVTRYRLFQFPQ